MLVVSFSLSLLYFISISTLEATGYLAASMGAPDMFIVNLLTGIVVLFLALSIASSIKK
jgi:hypothetical protein